MDLLFRAQTAHRENFTPNEVQVSTLLSIKTGACPEDCKYCPQSGHYNTELEKEKLMEVQKVLEEAALAKEKGASRFCMEEEQKDRVGLLRQLSQMSPHPKSVPINMLVKVEGTPLEDLDTFEFI